MDTAGQKYSGGNSNLSEQSFPSLERRVKGLGCHEERSEGHAERAKTRQWFATRKRPHFQMYFFSSFPHSSRHTAAVWGSRPTTRISAGRIKDRNAEAFRKTYYRRTRGPYWISAIDRRLQQGGGIGCIRAALSNNKKPNTLNSQILVFVFSESQCVSHHALILCPDNRDCKQPPSSSFLCSFISHHFLSRWAEWKWIFPLSRFSSSTSHALSSLSSSILGTEMQNKAGGMWKCGCNLKKPGDASQDMDAR